MLKKEIARSARHRGIRRKVIGTSERPRLCVHRSLKQLYAQVIDDVSGRTLCSFSSLDKNFQKSVQKLSKVPTAEKLGDYFGESLKKKGITQIAFDRSGYKYHGRVKALAESLRKAGIQF